MDRGMFGKIGHQRLVLRVCEWQHEHLRIVIYRSDTKWEMLSPACF